VTAVKLLQLGCGPVANGNDQTLGITWLQVAAEDEQSFSFCNNAACHVTRRYLLLVKYFKTIVDSE